MRAGIVLGLIAAAGIVSSTAPAQVAEPGKAVMIFFDWGEMTIGRDYQALLDAEAAARVKAPQTTVAVDAHSDRSGTAAANHRSSRLRADAVRNYLVAKGIPADRIEVRAWGEERPLIATADGVREPQNRRVDVRFKAQGSN